MTTDRETAPDESGCAPVRCQGVANTSIDLFTALLEQTAEAGDGRISAEEIRAIAEVFKRAPGKLAGHYRQTFAACSGETLARSQPTGEVRNPYRQLVMTQISNGLMRNLPINRDARSTSFPPRLLKAIAKGLERALPREFVTKANAKAATIESRLRTSLGKVQFSWDAYCQDPESQKLLSDTTLELCESFKPFGKQADRLVAEVNDLLGNVAVSKGVYIPGPPAVFGLQQLRRAVKAMIEEVTDAPVCRAPKDSLEAGSDKAALDDDSRSLIRVLYRKVA